MIGLIMSAVGAAASLAGSVMPNKNVVENTKVYSPDSSSFQSAGLFNNSVADIGMVEGEKNVEQMSDGKAALQGLGAVANIASSFMGGGRKKSASTPETGDVNTASAVGMDALKLGLQ